MKKENIYKGALKKVMKKGVMLGVITSALTVFAAIPAMACTSVYVGKDLTVDGSTMFGRTEDISSAYNKNFVVHEAATHADGAMYDDGTGFTMPLANQTYRYTACEDDPAYGDGPFAEAGYNEYGVAMSATESASPADVVSELDPFTEMGIRETNMVSAILPQVKSAKEGIELLAFVLDTYGAGEGNTLMIADQKECWYMEILTGHQYIAIKMPTDKAALLPNCFMIQTVDLTDAENVISSANLVSLVDNAKYLVEEDGKINVRESYCYGEGYGSSNTYRIWGGQTLLAPSLSSTVTPADTDYNMFFTPDAKVSVKDLYQLDGYRYEGTPYENTNVRVIGTPSSVECHIMQIRPDMPTELAGIEWLCMGSADYSVFLPYYASAITDTYDAYKVENTTYDPSSAYWTFRALSTSSALNRTFYGTNVKAYWGAYMDSLIEAQKSVDEKMLDLYNSNPSAVSEKATQLGKAVAEEAITNAKTIYNELLTFIARYDGKTVSKTFTPSLLTKNTYSLYNYDMVEEDPTPTEAPTAVPTATPTVAPTATPTAAPTATPVVITKTSLSEVSVLVKDITYTGAECKPEVTITVDGKKLTLGTDFAVTYRNNIETGLATVVMTGQGNYTGSRTATFKILPKKVVLSSTTKSLKKGKLQVAYAKVIGASGYKITYSTSKKFTSSKTVQSTALKTTLKNLKSGKKYYVKVTAYKKAGTVKIYGSTSKVKTIKVK